MESLILSIAFKIQASLLLPVKIVCLSSPSSQVPMEATMTAGELIKNVAKALQVVSCLVMSFHLGLHSLSQSYLKPTSANDRCHLLHLQHRALYTV